MKQLLAIAAVLMTLQCFSQAGNDIKIGKIDTIHSNILNETRQVWIHLPASANNSVYSKSVFPVLYLLDAPANFHMVTGMVQQLSAANGNTVIPEMIVVGIQNTDRTRDLTPTHSTVSPYGQSPESLKTSGGGDQFLAFMEKELMPYIDSTYPVAPHRMLVGHSFGGLMVMHTLLNKPDLLSSYVAIDPSLWWDEQKLAKQAITALQQGSFPAKPLYVAIANTLHLQKDFASIEKDTAGTSIGMKAALQLVTAIDRYKTANQPWHWKYYADDSHGSVTLIAQYDAFRSFFKGHQLELPADPAAVDVQLYIKHYQAVSELMGYHVPPPEVRLHRMGSALMDLGLYEKAYAFFQLNLETYPNSFVGYHSMGEYYEAKEEKQKAIEYFKKALALREFPVTRRKLEKLMKEN